MSTNRQPVRLLVCGNEDRRDDGAAIWAVAHLVPGTEPGDLPGTTVIRCAGLDVADLVDSSDGAPILIVDTAVGVPAGSVVTLDFDTLLAEPRDVAPHSSHALPIDQVIGIARAVSQAPVDGLFVGIGAADVGFGSELSVPVREGMGDFVIAIQRALMRLNSEPAHVH